MSVFYDNKINELVKDDKQQFLDIALSVLYIETKAPQKLVNALCKDIEIDTKCRDNFKTVLEKVYCDAIPIYKQEVLNKKAGTELIGSDGCVRDLGVIFNDRYKVKKGVEDYRKRIIELLSTAKDDRDSNIRMILYFIRQYYPNLVLSDLSIPEQFAEDADFLIQNGKNIKTKQFSLLDEAKFFGNLNESIIRSAMNVDQSKYFLYTMNLAQIQNDGMFFKDNKKVPLILNGIQYTPEYKKKRHSYTSMQNLISKLFHLSGSVVQPVGTMYLIRLFYKRGNIRKFEGIMQSTSMKYGVNLNLK